MARPPSAFHRWIAAHPFQWAAIVGGVVLVVGLSSAMSSLDGFELAVIVVIGVAGAAAALVGALLTRRMVQRNDATSPQ